MKEHNSKVSDKYKIDEEKLNNFVKMIKEYRTKNFSPLIKRRFVIGSYVLQAENKEKYDIFSSSNSL